MRQPVQVLVYPVRPAGSSWEVLLLHRLPSRGDFWQGVSGGVEELEEVAAAARRELLEETGLVPLALQQIDYSYAFPVADQWRHLYAARVEEIVEFVFLATVDAGQTPVIDGREHDQFMWCSLDDALARLTWPGNIEALKHCHRALAAWSGPL